MADRGTYDFGRRAADYARFRPGPPESFFDRLETFIPLAGVDAVDLGTGPGKLALVLAERGANVVGVDCSERQIEAAARAAQERGLADRCVFRTAPAEATGLPDGCADLVVAGQCWGWFDQDRARAEVRRLLRPRGLLAVMHYCYLPRLDDVARRTEALILSHNPAWKHADFDGLYPQRVDALAVGGLEFVEQFCYDYWQPMTHEEWRGRIRTCSGVGSGQMSEEEVARYDGDLAEMLRREHPDEPLSIRHRVWAVIARHDGRGGAAGR